MLALGTLAKRIDAFAFLSATTYDLVEVKPDNPAQATGQLLSYRALARDTYPQLTLRNLLLITAREDDDLLPITRQMGIQVIIIP